jgi:hypothetical protein
MANARDFTDQAVDLSQAGDAEAADVSGDHGVDIGPPGAPVS